MLDADNEYQFDKPTPMNTRWTDSEAAGIQGKITLHSIFLLARQTLGENICLS